MIFSKYPRQKLNAWTIGFHYIDHRSNHKHNAKLRKEFRSKDERKGEREVWNHNNKALNVFMTPRMAFSDRRI